MNLAPLLLFGHAFGQNFSLPLPIWMFIFGGVAAVLLSFVLVGLLYDAPAKRQKSELVEFSDRQVVYIGAGLKWLSFAIFLIAITAGLAGSPYPMNNILVTLFWVVLLVGFTYFTALFGNIWQFISPFRTVVQIAEKFSHKQFTGVRAYPSRYGYYPALAIYVVVICLELLMKAFGTSPPTLSGFLMYYSIITVAGCLLYGSAAWFRYVDFFSVFFRLVARLSMLDYRGRTLVVRRPFAGLVDGKADHGSLLLFIIFMIASTSFDGLTETKGYLLFYKNYGHTLPRGLFGLLALVAITLSLYGLYLLFIKIVKLLISSKLSAHELSLAFAFTLIPIAVGYNVAHYLSYLLTNSQYAIVQISDPFAIGWNLFGTADYHVNPTPLNPYATWYIQVGAIVAGHVVAIYTAHLIAVKLFKGQSAAVTSQLPVVVLMLLFTTMSLWIVAQPVYVATAASEAQQQQTQDQLQKLRQPPVPQAR